MQIDKRSKVELKKYFVKNAIPTESHFAELIDGMLNQKDDGIAKPPNDPLSIEAVGDDKKALHFYSKFSDPTPSWVLSLNPRQDPANATTAKAGLSISDSAGNSRLFIDRSTGSVGIGTTLIASGTKLQVAGTVRANRFMSDNSLVLNDYTTLNPSSNVYLYSPPNDRDAWIYLDSAGTENNWGIYHRQIDNPAAVKGLPLNSIGFIGASKLQAYIALGDGSAFFAGNVLLGSKLTATGGVQANGKLHAVGNAGVLDIEGADHAYIQWYPMKASAGRKGWIGYGGANTTTMAVTNDVGELHLNGQGVRVNTSTVFASKVNAAGYGPTAGGVNAPNMEIGGPNPVADGSGGGVLYLHHHGKISHQLRYNGGTLFLEAAGNGYGTTPRPTLALGGDLVLEGKVALRGNDGWLRLNQDGQFSSGVHTPGRLDAAKGVKAYEIGIGTQDHGATSWPYETIQMNPGHNLRIWYGTTERFVFANTGYFQANAFRSAPGNWGALGADGTVMTDNVTYKALMIVGSNQNQGKARWVRLWDYLTVHGGITAEGEIESTGAFLRVRGAGSEGIYIGGDGAGNDVQIGSTNASIMNVVAWNTTHGRMDFFCRKLDQTSDLRLKEKIEPVTGALDKVSRLRGIWFDWKNQPTGTPQPKNLGLIAQEVKEVLPEAVTEGRDGFLGLSYQSITVLLLEAMKEQQKQIEELRDELKELRSPRKKKQ